MGGGRNRRSGGPTLKRIAVSAFVITGLLVSTLALAGAYDDVVRCQAAFQQAKSWHAEEHLPNGKTVAVDYSAPGRWRIQPSPTMTELVIGNDIYMVRNGRATKMPFGGALVSRMIERFRLPANDDEMKKTIRDLGSQKLNGQTVHVYAYTVRGVPETLYVGKDSLPVQAVTKNKGKTTTINYSKFNESLSIEVPSP